MPPVLMKRILLAASKRGYQSQAFADAAKRLGFEIQLATDSCHQLENPWGDGAISLDFNDSAGFAGHVAGMHFDGVAAVGDHPAFVAAVLARSLGLPGNPPEAVAASRDKFTARERFHAAGLPVPRYVRFPLSDLPSESPFDIDYPCVVKPLSLSGSRGVIRADNAAELQAAGARLRRILATSDIRRRREEQDAFILVEQFIPGPEYALEGVLSEGRLQTFAIFDKPDPLDGPFFEESIYVTPSRASVGAQREMTDAVATAASALGLYHGPVHAEMRVNDRGVWMLEVAARPIGGLCARAVQFESGAGLEEVLLRHCAGEDVRGERLLDQGSAVMMIPIPRAGIYRGVSGVEEALRVPGVTGVEITASPGQEMQPLPEGSSYLGFIFARARTRAAAEESVRRANASLTFELASTLPVRGR